MRKPSPISISSPRETSTSRPSASAASASSTAAALLLTTSAASAPVSRAQQRRRGGPAASRARRRRGRTRGSSSRAPTSRDALRAPPRASGARPRFVCTITPVALSDAAQARPPRRLRARRSARSTRSPGSSPAAISSRARASAARDGGDGERVRLGGEARVAQQLVDRGQVAQLHVKSLRAHLRPRGCRAYLVWPVSHVLAPVTRTRRRRRRRRVAPTALVVAVLASVAAAARRPRRAPSRRGDAGGARARRGSSPGSHRADAAAGDPRRDAPAGSREPVVLQVGGSARARPAEAPVHARPGRDDRARRSTRAATRGAARAGRCSRR